MIHLTTMAAEAVAISTSVQIFENKVFIVL